MDKLNKLEQRKMENDEAKRQLMKNKDELEAQIKET